MDLIKANQPRFQATDSDKKAMWQVFARILPAGLFQLDVLWLDQHRVDDATVSAIRDRIAGMLRETRAWRWLIGQPSDGTEISLGELIAKLFVSQNDLGKGPRCYLPNAAADRRSVLMDLLTQLACDAAASTFSALAFMSLMQVRSDAHGLRFMDRATAAWWRSHGTRAHFWVDYGIGTRVFEWCEGLSDDDLKLHTNAQAVLRISDVLLKCGVPEGSRLEAKVRDLSESRV